MSDNLTLYLSSSHLLLKAMSTNYQLYDINTQINRVQSQVTELIKPQEGISGSVEVVELLTELVRLTQKKERISSQVNSSLVESILKLLEMIDNLLLSTKEDSTELRICQQHLQSIIEFARSCQMLDFSSLNVEIYRIVNLCRQKQNPYWDNIALSLSRLLSIAGSQG